MLRIQNGSIKRYLHVAIVALVMCGLVPLAAAADRYVATTGTNSGDCSSVSSPCLTISYAITQSVSADTINVATGTYIGDLVIPASKSDLELKPAVGADVTIKGVQKVLSTSFPLAAPNIEIRGNGTKIHGFTIEGPAPALGYYSSGMVIGATDVEIYDNAFKVPNAGNTNDVSQGIQTYHKNAVPTVDVSGLSIRNNTFTNLGTETTPAGFEAIYINRDTGSGTVTVDDNQFTGDVIRAITTERSNTTISDNSIVTDLLVSAGFQGILVRDSNSENLDNVMVTGNTVKGSEAGDGFGVGILIGSSAGSETLTNISVKYNTVQSNTTGVRVRASADGVIVNFNDISGNATGVQNNDTANTLDATYNWWGDSSGPDDSTGTTEVPACTSNPATEMNNDGVGDPVSDDVDYCPWLTENTDFVVSSITGPSTAEAGTDIDVKVTTKNRGTEWAAPTITRLYLSTDTIFDEDDIQIGSVAVPELVAGQSYMTDPPVTVSIPGDIAGKLYIIAKADADDYLAESDETNNTKSMGKPVKIGSDLFVKAFTVPTSANAGDTISVVDKTTNRGPAIAGASTTSFWLSTNFTLDDGDYWLGSRVVPELAVKGSSQETTPIFIPATIDTVAPLGIYYIIVKADADDDQGEVDENNNSRFRKIKISGAADLEVSFLAATGSAGAGDSIDVDDTTENTGTANARATTTRFYLSDDSTFNPGDIPLGSRAVPALAASASDSATTSVEIPADTEAGSYHIIARADSNGQVAEDSETNNTASTAITISP
jgi:subtilase family serine protease